MPTVQELYELWAADSELRDALTQSLQGAADFSALKPENMRFDRDRRLLVIDLPTVKVREPIPLLAEMKIEPKYKGLRGPALDAAVPHEAGRVGSAGRARRSGPT